MSSFPREFGNYSLMVEVGRGAMGVVYKAQHKSLGRTVALKVMERSKSWAGDAEVARFEREGKILAQLSHPDIVAVHDSGVELDKLYIAMEYVDGMPLDRYIKSRLPNLEESLEITARLARALDYVHSHGIVHRDIKPSNILVDPEGNPKITDFGLAKVEGTRLTRSGGLLGTPMYMSPEQARGEGSRADARSDIYSLGTVLYEMITGVPPYTAATLEALVHKVLHEDPLPPRTLDHKIPRDVETLCLKALAKEPARRYATAREMAEDIERFLKHEPILARRSSPAERVWRWTRHHKGIAAVSAVALALAGVGAAVTLYLVSRIRDSERAVQRQEERPLLRSQIERLYKNRDYAGALALLQPLAGTPHDDASTSLWRAICLRETGRRGDSEAELDAYVKRFPEDPAGWRHRGLNLLESGDFAGSIPFYSQAARLTKIPEFPEAQAQAEYDAVIVLVERHFKNLDPQTARPYLATCSPDYDFTGNPARWYTYHLGQEWMTDFFVQTMAPLKHSDMDAWFVKHGEHPVLLGWRALKRQDDLEGSLRDLNRAVELVPISRWLRFHRFAFLMKLKKYEEADRESAVLKVLVPHELSLRWAMARIRGESSPLRAAREIESIADDLLGGILKNDRIQPSTLLTEAAWYAASAGDAAEAVRLLRKAPPSTTAAPTRDSFAKDPAYAKILNTPEFKKYLEGLPE